MRKAVEKALQHWRNQGLLTVEQVAELTTSIEEHERGEESGRAAAIFGSIGAVLTGLGVILFVASNWAGMGPTTRTLVLLGGYGVVVAAAVLAERRGLPRVAESVWLLATLVLGANIFLFAQTFHLSLTYWQGTFGWMIGALAMGYARQSVAQAAFAVPIGILTLGWMGGGSGWFFDDKLQFLYVDAGLRPVLPILGLGLIALSALVAARDDLTWLRTPTFRWGTAITAGSLIITTINGETARWFYSADFTLKQILVMVLTAGVVAAAFWKGELESRWSRPALAGTMVFLLFMLLPPGGGLLVWGDVGFWVLAFFLYVLAVFALALFSIWLGISARNTRLVNVGMTSTVLLIIIQYFGWSSLLLDRSLAFILGGVLLIGLSVLVEKKRREIMTRIAADSVGGE